MLMLGLPTYSVGAKEIVQDGCFDGERGRQQIIKTKAALQCREYKQLDGNSHTAYHLEFPPAHPTRIRGAHEIRSSLYRRHMFRTVTDRSMALMPIIPTMPPTSKSLWP